MKLSYTAYDNGGQSRAGTIDCPDMLSATETLRRQGLYVADITEAAETSSPASSPAGRRRRARGHKLQHIAVFTRQLAVLLATGTPLVEALGALERQAKAGSWRDTVVALRSRIEDGASLSQAMEADPGSFDPVYTALVSAGESSGQLATMLERLAGLKQKQLHLRNAVVGAMIYPCLLLTVVGLVFAMLLVFIVPRFAMLFQSLDVPLPPSTKVLVWCSTAFRATWPIILVLVGAAITAVVHFLKRPAGRQFRDTLLVRLPYVGPITQSIATARIVRLLSVLLSGHVPVLEALRLMEPAAGNIHYSTLLAKARDHVSKGEPLSLAFNDARLISPSVYEAVRSGEQNGQIDRLMLNMADFLDDENEITIRSLTSILEPVILIAMGLVVGLVAVSMFMPLFDLTAMTGRGGS
jgi:type II secretory pathway component PulF